MVDEIFEDYPYVGLTGSLYIPYVKKGKWYIIPDRECSFSEFVLLCHVPAEDAVLLKLKHGVANTVQNI